MDNNELTEKVIGASIEVHKVLGPGLLESAYEQCLARELTLRNIKFLLQKPVPIEYKGILLDCGYRFDMLVEEKLMVELKSVDNMSTIFTAQILTYMKLAKMQLGLLINFNVKLLKDGIQRFVL